MNRTELTALAIILLLAFVIRAHPLALDSFGGPDPHFHARMSELVIAGQGVPEYDELSMQGRFYSYAPLYHLMYAFFALFSALEMRFLVMLLPALYGCAAVLLVYAFSNRIFNSQKIALFSALALSVMPMHLVRTSAYSRPDGLALLIVPAVIYLFYIKRTRIAALLSIGLVLLHPLSTLYLLLFLLLWSLASKFASGPAPRLPSLSQHEFLRNFPAKSAFLTVLLTFAVFLIWLCSQQYPIADYISGTSFESAELVRMYVLSFFAFFTFSWLFVLLALFKSRRMFPKLWLLYSFAFAAVGMRLGIFMALPAAILAGFGIEYAWQKIKPYSKPFLLLLFLLLAITALPRINMQGQYISVAERSAMLWLNSTAPQGAGIAAQWDMGHPLTYYAQRPVVIDGYFEFAPGLEARNDAIKNLLSTSDCGKISENAGRYNATHIFIPERGLKDRAYRNGILEANDCPRLSSVFVNDSAMVMEFG